MATFKLFLTACLAAGVSVSVHAAMAHSVRESTSPADGAVLERVPEVIAMTFGQPMRLTLVRLTDSERVEVEITRTDGMAPVTEFQARPVGMGPGVYTLGWRGMSVDGHPMDGSLSFRIAD